MVYCGVEVEFVSQASREVQQSRVNQREVFFELALN